jgi:hypothetical protein
MATYTFAPVPATHGPSYGHGCASTRDEVSESSAGGQDPCEPAVTSQELLAAAWRLVEHPDAGLLGLAADGRSAAPATTTPTSWHSPQAN